LVNNSDTNNSNMQSSEPQSSDTHNSETHSSDTQMANDAEPRLSPWQIETRRRWIRLGVLIAETEYDLSQTSGFDDRKALEASLRQLRRASLSVWVDARRAGVALPSESADRPGALVESQGKGPRTEAR
jgi:hypothetical protein